MGKTLRKNVSNPGNKRGLARKFEKLLRTSCWKKDRIFAAKHRGTLSRGKKRYRGLFGSGIKP